MLKKLWRNEKGFTMIEMMVVLIVSLKPFNIKYFNPQKSNLLTICKPNFKIQCL